MLRPNWEDKPLPAHGTTKEWVENQWEVDMIVWHWNAAHHRDFSTIQEKILAYEHQAKNKVK